MSELYPYERRLAENWPPEEWQEVTVLAAVSGGADSVALLRALERVKRGGAGRLCAAHFNHRLREEAAADEQFVKNLCAELGISCQFGAAEVALATNCTGEGVEAAARRVRYAFLAAAAGRCGARFVVTAHTVGDQAETILHRVLRGTGIRGLAGMPRTRPLGPATLIRPMLSQSRSEVLAYLHDLEQPYREDMSNADHRFTRNRLRGELLPLLARRFNPRVEEVLLRLGRLAGEVQQLVDTEVDTLFERAVECPDASRAILRRAELLPQPQYLLRELLMRVWRRQGWPRQAMGGAHWEQLAEMLVAGGTGEPSTPWKQTFPGAVLAEVTGDAMQLIRLPS